jgi:tetratricopeptide (TPR) repeat protein
MLARFACFLHRLTIGPPAGAVVLALMPVLLAIPGERALAQGAPKTIESFSTPADIEKGVNAGQRALMDTAHGLVKQRKYEEAETALREIIVSFEKLMTDPDAVYLCFANREELTHYLKNNPAKKKVVWLDWCFGNALHDTAFIAVARKEWQQALKVLDREQSLRPYAAEPHTERGFVLNKLGKLQEGLKEYQVALQLAQKHGSSKHMQGTALRGSGWTLVELGDLKGAREAYEQSLKAEPNNPLAQEELRYIDKLLSKK